MILRTRSKSKLSTPSPCLPALRSSLYPIGSGIVLHLRSYIQDARCRILGPGWRTLEPGSWILDDPESENLKPAPAGSISMIFGEASSICHPGEWIQGPACSIQDSGFWEWIQDAGSLIKDPLSFICLGQLIL